MRSRTLQACNTRINGFGAAATARYTGGVHPAPAFESKICAPAELTARIAQLARPLVFTNGVFDILHRGHASYLAQARALGASLLVAVNSDVSVQRLGKGPDRPINALADRMAERLYCRLLPHVLVKGGDWAADKIVGAAEVKNWHGAVHSIPFIHERSTTETLKKIRGL